MNITEILDEDFLLRRIPINNPNYIKEDGTICSYAFKPRGKFVDEISVNVKKLTTYNDSIINSKEFCLAQLKVEVPRRNNLEVVHTPEKENYSHANIKGNFSKSACRNLARQSMIINEKDFLKTSLS